ncbi:MAG: hypothetical protein KAJ18_07185 [Candidatus Omnitrophica bacterium]|nr:hypothetical protein [Candidatus Omnitrophota bacterium]
MAEFDQIITKLREDYTSATQSGSGNAYSKLSTIFEELDIYLRERIQEMTQEDIKGIIEKLEKGEQLSLEDKEQVRLWIVGDAEYYTQMENNFGDWQDELKRLIGEIERYQGESLDPIKASKLRALFRDGARVISDIFYYVEQKERVEKFMESTAEIDEEERAILIRLLEQKIASPDF